MQRGKMSAASRFARVRDPKVLAVNGGMDRDEDGSDPSDERGFFG